MNQGSELKNVDKEIIEFFQAHEEVILDAWKTEDGGSKYPFDYQNPGGYFTKMMSKAIPYIENRRVLDIGCNAGLNSLIAAFSAKKVIGCDRNDVLVARANAAKDALEEYRTFSNLSFATGDFSRFLTEEVNAIIVARVLYHLTDEGIEKLKRFINSLDDFVLVVHTRPGRKRSATQVYNGLIELEDIEEFFADAGLRLVDSWGAPRHKFIVGRSL